MCTYDYDQLVWATQFIHHLVPSVQCNENLYQDSKSYEIKLLVKFKITESLGVKSSLSLVVLIKFVAEN